MTLGIVLLYGPRRGVFLMSEVPLYVAVGLVHLSQSRGAFGHEVPDIQDRMTKRLKGGSRVGLV